MHVCDSTKIIILIYICSKWKTVKSTHVSNALVAVLGIGEYDGMPNLIGVSKDYFNLIHTFYNHFHYTVAFNDNNKKFNYCNQSIANSKAKQKQTKDVNCKLTNKSFQLKWEYKEIFQFVQNVAKMVNNKENKHDALIFCISSHGDQDGVILASDCEEFQLLAIFDAFFGKKCPFMLDKPKLFVIDACRGQMRANADDNKTDDSNVAARGGNEKNKKQSNLTKSDTNLQFASL